MHLSPQKRWAVATVAMLALASIYILQRSDILSFKSHESVPTTLAFSLNRIIRLIINDLSCVALIKVLFLEKKYVRLALGVFFVELLVLLPVYLAVKLTLEGPTELSSPALAQVHRMVVNPLLMFLLIVGIFYSRLRKEGSIPD